MGYKTHTLEVFNGRYFFTFPDQTQELLEQEFWDITRHELVAGAADELLSAHAKEMVRVTLEPLGLVGLSDIAGWADSVKRRGPRPG